ncbi:MAG: bifunctional UDP-3-O-[3-hydroxymyristoyl] N-acetylglucosamine deacetylase/3-hydroxyacyl-ACP dehydratase [candidate division KSB1 bacterium]|nr:bifunctional UDP-3-O-[3-hydroxymyristoyl] N-acetylglucosamine deacetylase/3-hydroxyacyl-ACP dehydratase [candidate division KSB1 bacterium]MDZ7317995.1 bifunctional UDP-3-O-[3-hydroxymyristoyl] N-acetylglucosamine deacetylase/3-hydroxyacyl-ACP dehydratase [candidate division KSB1 bacterium]MDZ7340648.1 bifunctional UDP-3-O-[3-hydroxymyristoyl] N-acetylglucosamine deacetylase/3-hydroxyacyl-ACP dehydratase [candidate division KSB1 bacterium]
MLKNQRTIKKPVSISGIGLHTGNASTLTFKPAPENTGIRFKRIDIQDCPEIVADIDHVMDISRGTTIGQNCAVIHTVEHVLAAVAGLEIDNILVELTNNEPPVIDGSSLPFVEILLEAGFEEQNSPKDYVIIEDTIAYHEEKRRIDIVVVPSDQFRITFMVDYQNPALGTQYTSLYSLEEEFITEYAPARTFCFLHEVEMLKEQGLIKGGNVDNAIVIIDRKIDETEFDRLKRLFKIPNDVILGANGILDGKELRFYNEPVRHKALDLIGDLALLGVPIIGHIMAARSGHAANVELVKMLRKEFKKKKITSKYQQRATGKGVVLDINAIQNILPHRYPFLLVDKIIDLVPKEHVVGIKNVTANEPFFNGHFPGRPIMPGVLIIEAMAQVGGILLLDTEENPAEKLVYFTGIDKVKFRKLVLPGDQLRFELDMLRYRQSICKMAGKAFVGDELVCEAELSAAVVNR